MARINMIIMVRLISCINRQRANNMSDRSLGKVSGVLLDLSGTLHTESTPTPSAISAMGRLRDVSIPVRFITNTTKESKRLLFSRLRNMGFDLSQDELFTSLTAAHRLVESEKLHPLLLLEDSAKEDFEGLGNIEREPDCVVVGLSPTQFGYHDLNQAFRLLLDGAKLVAIHKAKYYKQPDGLALGPGPFVTALEYASGHTAEVVGKPEPSFFNSVLKELQCPADEIVMIGDDILNDIQGAQTVGVKGILVKTGKYRPGDEHTIDLPPHAVCENFAEAVELILRSKP